MELKAYTDGEDRPFVTLETDQGTQIIERADGTITITRDARRGAPSIRTKVNERTGKLTITLLTFEER